MLLQPLDYGIIIVFFLGTLALGLYASKKAEKSVKDYFLSGREMPWWLLGISMVATTFAADTPTLVTDIVRNNGVSGNWVWWAFLLTGMTTVFIYAKLWRRSGIVTDLEFYEMRYSGKGATFLRGFRAIYLGVFFNVMIMATVLLAGIKISGVMLGIGAHQTILLVGVVTVSYSTIGGLRGVILTDFFQFILSMIGMIVACIYIVSMPEIGGVSALIEHPLVSGKVNLLPDLTDMETVIPLLLIPLAVQWWSAWYPGAEPGGGGYIAQRMLSAKDEKAATLSTLLFNISHYALRPWPWILIALASLIIFPDLASIQKAFPNINSSIVKDDLAFPAMMTLLPKGLVGLVIASLIAALMSTISTHLNWGSSYLVHDFYLRLIEPEASQRKLVNIGRISTIILMILASILALYLTNALQAFNILLQIGAGTGLIFLLRWFWWRINAYSEIAAMLSSLLIAIYFQFFTGAEWLNHHKMLIGVVGSSTIWLLVTLLTRPTKMSVLKEFYQLIRPYERGWKVVSSQLTEEQLPRIDGSKSNLPKEILMAFIACLLVYSCLFGLGYLIYGWNDLALICFVVVMATAVLLGRMLKRT